jgi:hypothetical protein
VFLLVVGASTVSLAVGIIILLKRNAIIKKELMKAKESSV